MKTKVCIIVLCLMLICANSIVALGEEVPSRPIKTIKLSLSKDSNEISIMEKTDISKFGFSKDNREESIQIKGENSIEIDIIQIENNKDFIAITGKGVMVIDGTQKNFVFDNAKLNIAKNIDGRDYIYGTIDSNLIVKGKAEPLIIDVMGLKDFSKVVLTTACGMLEDNLGILFWGDIFMEYNALYNWMKNIEEKGENITIDNNNLTRASYGNYDYVNKASNSTISSNQSSGGSGETIIMVVGKRDFRDGNSSNGYEMVKVLARMQNAKTYIADATSAHPIEAEIDFTCNTSGFMDVDDVAPKSKSNGMPGIFNFVSTLYPEVGTAIAAVNLVHYKQLNGVNYTINATSGNSFDNHANIKLDLTTTGAANVNLPATTTYSNAHTDTSHGVTGEIKYDEYNTSLTTGNITVKSRMKYRFYYGTSHRTTTAQTGYASLTHNIYR